jgi:cation-transporting P-type ATPase 13A2
VRADLSQAQTYICLVGWTGPFPVLCRKRPTANLVSRKVLTPLLGQIAISILIQAVGFHAVRRQPWCVFTFQNHYFNTNQNHRFIPPHLDREKSNIENSENTTLFLVSCYEYILSGIVLSVGPPFRQSMAHNRKCFVICSKMKPGSPLT